MKLNRKALTINTKNIADEPPSKHKVMFVRMPIAIAERFEHQRLRLSASMNTLARMAIVLFLEESEAEVRRVNV
jgi:hypothetical protein